MSRLLVESALARVETAAELQRVVVKLNRFERLLGNLANNVNQLAHQANIAGQVVALDRVTAYLAGRGRCDEHQRPRVVAGQPGTVLVEQGSPTVLSLPWSGPARIALLGFC